MNKRFLHLLGGGPLLLGLALGCDKFPTADDVQKTVNSSVNNAVETVKQQIDLAGSIEVNLGTVSSIRTSGCYLTLGGPVEGGPGVLQLKSYHDASGESFPSMMFWARTSTIRPTELAGQKVTGHLFVQVEADGPVWHTPEDQAIELSIDSSSEGVFKATFTGGKLATTADDSLVDVTGSVEGALP